MHLVWHLDRIHYSSSSPPPPQFSSWLLTSAHYRRTLHHRILCEVTETTLSIIWTWNCTEGNPAMMKKPLRRYHTSVKITGSSGGYDCRLKKGIYVTCNKLWKTDLDFCLCTLTYVHTVLDVHVDERFLICTASSAFAFHTSDIKPRSRRTHKYFHRLNKRCCKTHTSSSIRDILSACLHSHDDMFITKVTQGQVRP